MAEWIYRAAAKKADWNATTELLAEGFLCRPVYSSAHRIIANVRKVNVGDKIHVAFTWETKRKTNLDGIGSFEIIDSIHPDLGERVVHDQVSLPLFTVRHGSDLHKKLEKANYKQDPKLGAFTGWHVKEEEKREIAFTKEMFPGKGALVSWQPKSHAKDSSVVALPRAHSPIASKALTPVSSAQAVAFPDTGIALGVDWSGAVNAGRKVWAARIVFNAKGHRLDFLRQPFRDLNAAGIAARFGTWLQSETFDTAGLDFCFGVARHHQLAGMPTQGPKVLGPWLAAHYPTYQDFKIALGRELKRETDRIRRSPFAPTNLRMCPQTYWGIRALGGIAEPILPWSPVADRAVVEVLPAHVVSKLLPGCRYKGRTPEARAKRQELLDVLRTACRIEVSGGDENTIVRDADGDALDAVLAAIAAGAARHNGFAGVPSDAASSGEGWIYSIP